MQVANANVPVRIDGRHVPVTAAIVAYVEEKIDHLHLDYPRIIDAHVVLDVQKYRHFCEIILHCANHLSIEAADETGDLYAAIDGAIAKIAQRMRKFKGLMIRNHRPRRGSVKHLREDVIEVSDTLSDLEEEATQPTVIRTERYAVKPMHVDEAVLQMEMSQRQFVVFLNAVTEKVSILHRRKDGGYGLIEPSFD
jgi:putative sigma-54 modulation protein